MCTVQCTGSSRVKSGMDRVEVVGRTERHQMRIVGITLFCGRRKRLGGRSCFSWLYCLALSWIFDQDSRKR